MGKKKITRVPLREDWAQSLLAAPTSVTLDGKSLTCHQRLQNAIQELTLAVDHARTVLHSNPLAETVAEAAAKEQGWRKPATLCIDSRGGVFLEISGNHSEGKHRKWESQLPSLSELREQAAALGVDIAALGRAKHQILQAIQEAPSAVPPTPAPRKMVKTAPAVGPVTILSPESVLVSPVTPPVQPVPAPTPRKKSALQQAMEASEDIDLDSFLGGPPSRPT